MAPKEDGRTGTCLSARFRVSPRRSNESPTPKDPIIHAAPSAPQVPTTVPTTVPTLDAQFNRGYARLLPLQEVSAGNRVAANRMPAGTIVVGPEVLLEATNTKRFRLERYAFVVEISERRRPGKLSAQDELTQRGRADIGFDVKHVRLVIAVVVAVGPQVSDLLIKRNPHHLRVTAANGGNPLVGPGFASCS